MNRLLLVLACMAPLLINAQTPMLTTPHEPQRVENPDLHIEVWSDIVCPFCYLGKRRLERALASLPEGLSIRVEWKSFELDPERVTRTDVPVTQLLAEEKGMPLERMQQMTEYVTAMAREEGLEYALDESVWTNTFQAHVLIHWAKLNGKQHAMKERLFRAHFMEGANVDDRATLLQLAVEVGLDEEQTQKALDNPDLANDVRSDEYESRTLGVRGVPFFLINGETAISGAQPIEAFQDALNGVLSALNPEPPAEGPVCNPDGECD